MVFAFRTEEKDWSCDEQGLDEAFGRLREQIACELPEREFLHDETIINMAIISAYDWAETPDHKVGDFYEEAWFNIEVEAL